MIVEGKLLAAWGFTGGALLAAANVADASAGVLATIGVVGALGTAIIGVYSAFRSAKHNADVKDGPLVQLKLDQANERIAELEGQVEQWRDICQELRQALNLGQGQSRPGGKMP